MKNICLLLLVFPIIVGCNSGTSNVEKIQEAKQICKELNSEVTKVTLGEYLPSTVLCSDGSKAILKE